MSLTKDKLLRTFCNHYYKPDLCPKHFDNRIPAAGSDSWYGIDQSIISNGIAKGLTFFIRCAKCGDRRLINGNDNIVNYKRNGIFYKV